MSERAPLRKRIGISLVSGVFRRNSMALRPLVIGKGLKTPMLVILIGVIGGTLAYGIIGVFLGPIVLAVIWELLVAWMAEAEVAS